MSNGLIQLIPPGLTAIGAQELNSELYDDWFCIQLLKLAVDANLRVLFVTSTPRDEINILLANLGLDPVDLGRYVTGIDARLQPVRIRHLMPSFEEGALNWIENSIRHYDREVINLSRLEFRLHGVTVEAGLRQLDQLGAAL